MPGHWQGGYDPDRNWGGPNGGLTMDGFFMYNNVGCQNECERMDRDPMDPKRRVCNLSDRGNTADTHGILFDICRPCAALRARVRKYHHRRGAPVGLITAAEEYVQVIWVDPIRRDPLERPHIDPLFFTTTRGASPRTRPPLSAGLAQCVQKERDFLASGAGSAFRMGSEIPI